ncbi:MAG TPA: 3-hydroxyacyl-[acyl-carrier-protein] dehydratase FabZ [Lachnospiraceae bacterium]|nr:3-hydroxyacyl-ACP dehydratase FabZ [uncultured Lachnoclostridium sp.]HAU86663.1 3-hydroxyacyl-[acyl-carrier-protein] dehydratase FabZ [Lachnospiraceae bacterium]
MKKEEIYATLPHRYPMLFVDDIYEIDYGKHVRGVKNVSMNEPWVQGHFPEEPVFPGVLIIETMAQIGGFMFYSEEESKSLKAYLSKIDEVKFLRKVVPGEQLIVEADFISSFSKFAKVKCKGIVNGKAVAKAVVTYCFDEKINLEESK